MRPVSVFGSAVAVMVVASACATTSGSIMSSRFDAAPPPQRSTGLYAIAARDSGVAQAIADQVGPRVSIRAEISSFADSRRIRGVFHLDDDAYVVVGHIDADGVLRIAFPNEPTDDGFVRGNHSYQTSEFFAGFNSEYRFRARNSVFGTAALSPNAYDGRLGYVFVIASWRPMHFDRFQTENAWDSFELADENYMRDPRPAIHELATLLAGDNTEAYTVKFARYSDTQFLYAGASSFGSAFNSGYCSGYEPFGFASSPFGAFGYGYGYASSLRFGTNFAYRGTNYYYSPAEDCYRTSYGPNYGFGYGYRIAQSPFSPGTQAPARAHIFNVEGSRPTPPPTALPGHFFPKAQETAPTAGDVTPRSPEYRQRGLITDDGASTGPVRRQPRVDAQTPGEARTRPSIQEMINRRGETHETVGGGYAPRAEQNSGANDNPRQGGSPATRARTEPMNAGETRGYTRPEGRDNPRTEQPQRIQVPERSSPPTRSEPAPRMQAPERTSPPPARSEPRSEPASRPAPVERPTPPPAAASSPRVETPVKPPV